VKSPRQFAHFLSPVQFNSDLLRAEMLGKRVAQWRSENPETWAQVINGKHVLLGVPDDRGVELNHGFVGASSGPQAFRNAFYRLYDVRSDSGEWAGDKWVDCGDLVLQSSIADTHAALADVVHALLDHGAKRVHVIGGGHDFSFGSYWGHARSCAGVLPIINFDAHFDLRPVEMGVINSGTPFRRVIENLEERIASGRALLEVGIQRERNPQSLWDFAQSKGVSVAEYTGAARPWFFHRLPDVNECSLSKQVGAWIEQWLRADNASGALHLSIDLDVFPASAAQGTSASTSFGVPVETLWPCVEDILSRNICRVVDVAELCPARDAHSQTARLAAALVFRGSLSLDASPR
jgi:formiminoglutamase